MKAVLERIEDVAQNIKTFWFNPENYPEHTPGQYLRWYLPHENADERGERRWFTVSASPSEQPLISFTTKFAPEKSSSFKAKLQTLKPGDSMEYTGPFGDFVLPKDESLPLVFVGGGIGVTPFRSIIKYLADTEQKRDIQMIYAANSLEEIAFNDLFETNTKLTLILSNPLADWAGETGRLDGSRILDLTQHNDKTLFYLSGPEPMIEALVTDLTEKGLHETRIVTDNFPGYSHI